MIFRALRRPDDCVGGKLARRRYPARQTNLGHVAAAAVVAVVVVGMIIRSVEQLDLIGERHEPWEFRLLNSFCKLN